MEEVKNLLDGKNYYISSNGKLNYSCDTDVINNVLNNICG